MDRAIRMIEKGFVAYSQNDVLVPPIQNFYFEAANGDCCIKSAGVDGSDTFAVKVSAGFYDNPSRGLPLDSRCMSTTAWIILIPPSFRIVKLFGSSMSYA